MLRRIIKISIVNTLHWSGMGDLTSARAGRSRLALMPGYHRVGEEFQQHAGIAITAMLISLAS